MDQKSKLMRCLHHKGSAYRSLPATCQSLQGICYSKMSKMIEYSCTREINALYNFEKNRSTMKQFLSQLPVTVRENILENIPRFYMPGSYLFGLYRDEVLFSTGMRKLYLLVGFEFQQIHFEKFMHLASSEGKGLRTLIFDYSRKEATHIHVTPEIYQNIGHTFSSAEYLMDLRLSWVGDDVIMKLIGENCTRLQNLELSHSSITAKGFHYLTQNFVKHPTETDGGSRVWESKFWGVPEIFPPLEQLLPEGEPVKFYERKKSSLCSTLKSLEIGSFNNSSSYEPMLAVTELIQTLESIIPCSCFFSNLFTKWYEPKKRNNNFVPSPLNLTSIVAIAMRESIFDMIITMCPKLRHISYGTFKPNTPSTFSLSSFNHFRCIESVNIYHDTSVLQTESFDDLSVDIREGLTEVTIFNYHAAKPFDISSVQECSALRCLYLHFPTIFWKGTSNGGLITSHDTMQNLSLVDLEAEVTGKTVLSLLECAPNLEYLTLSNIIEKKEDFLERILGMRKMPKLETFEVFEGFLLDTEDELLSFVTHFERIQHVGKIRFLSN